MSDFPSAAHEEATHNHAPQGDGPRLLRRVAIAVAAVMLSLVGAMSPGLVGAAPADAGDSPEATVSDPAIQITVTRTPNGSPFCAPGSLGLTPQTSNTPEAFTLKVVVTMKPCDPIAAKAVVYGMPGNGVAWPQQLLELEQFVINGTGTWEIRFAKQCFPAQFDVITGAAPQTIAPWGPHHGPLLFFGNTATSLQYWGAGDCSTPDDEPNDPGDDPTDTSTTIPDDPTQTDSSSTTIPDDPTQSGSSSTTIPGSTPTSAVPSTQNGGAAPTASGSSTNGSTSTSTTPPTSTKPAALSITG